MSDFQRIRPRPNRDSQPFWDACKRHELVLQYCRDCGRPWFYPRPCCPHCLSLAFDWRPVRGEGQVYTYTVVHRPPSEAYQDAVPYVVAIIELDEGVRMMSNVIGCPSEDVRIGMRVRVTFEDLAPETTLPKFLPA